MRIRQVRPEFFADPVVSRLPTSVRLTYIGLWCVADDAGWLVWNASEIAAKLYPYESVRVRERRVEAAGVALVDSGRMVKHDCGCANIPKLPDHQKIGGNKTTTVFDKHRVHTNMGESAGRVGYGSKGKLEARERARDDRAELLESYRRQGLPVDA